ncbi:LptF/LptG family permease [uncultured Arcobacter sp.]|uniref:LptF/LptG family permease n=1 Tax=uncultured Arcobacter sp. TaxID=165434 RepID=UPI0026027146|nr:LptF/LptG family permease [uncultured Arcobacter sp.]
MKLKQYLLSQFSNTFFPIFLVLYFITSIIFLVRIASVTSVITIDLFELLTLYAYNLPSIIFYTMPISFFVSLVITLSKLSSEYELIVITSFGLNPTNILKIFLPITFIMSISLLIISIGLIPKTKYLSQEMINQKTKEANFNIKASEFGQKFGDWLIYISKKDDKLYEEVKLFKAQKKDADQFIIAKNARLNNDSGNLSFVLKDGKTFFFEKDKINQIDYKVMHINDTLSESSITPFTDAFDYWNIRSNSKSHVAKLSFYVLTSIFPFISIYLVVAFGYFNPRYEKNRSVAYAIVSVVGFYLISDPLTKAIGFASIIVVAVFWAILSYYIYKSNVQKVY